MFASTARVISFICNMCTVLLYVCLCAFSGPSMSFIARSLKLSMLNVKGHVLRGKGARLFSVDSLHFQGAIDGNRDWNHRLIFSLSW
jgi:hypothetical protein